MKESSIKTAKKIWSVSTLPAYPSVRLKYNLRQKNILVQNTTLSHLVISIFHFTPHYEKSYPHNTKADSHIKKPPKGGS